MSDPLGVYCLHQLVDEQAKRNPDGVALFAPGRRPLTYGLLSRHIADVVGALNSLGIGRNDRVAMVLPEGPEMAVAFITIAAGATCAPLNPDSRATEFDLHLARLHCRALLVPSGSASPAVAVARARGIPILELTPTTGGEAGRFTLKQSAQVAGTDQSDNPTSQGMKSGFARPEDVALALYTSGTGGRPQLVPLTHRNVCASAHSIRAALDLVPSDRCLNVMPLFHIHGLSTIFASLAAGASVICTERFGAPQFFEWMKAFDPTWYTAAPTIHRAILDHALQHPGVTARSSLRFIRSASAAMPRQLIADMERVFQIPFIEAYGMTEAAPQITSNLLPPRKRKPGTVGLAAGPEVAIMDETGNLMPPGEDGEVVIRGTNVMQAYDNNPEANNSAFVRGWFRTGDRGHLDAEGYLFITGRLKDVINRGGEKISPVEVDEVLLHHPAVAQAVTFPVPHATLGEDVAAAIVLKPGVAVDVSQDLNGPAHEHLIQEIRHCAAASLAHFKVPQLILVMDEIPAGPTGKVQRMDLAERLGLLTPGQGLAAFTAPRTSVEERVSDIWAGVLGSERPGVHANFFQSGGDSLKAAQVCARLGRDFQIELPAHILFESPTVAELAKLVTRHLAKRAADGETTALLPERLIIPKRSATEPCPLSFAQQRLWFLDQIEPGNPAYNMHVALHLSGRLCLEALERSLGEILRRHHTLRTTIRTAGEQPFQAVSPMQPLRLPVVDLTRLPVADRRAEAIRLASDEAARPFHLVHGPLFRVSLLRLDAAEHVLLMTVHHIVSDGWSTGVLYQELETLYAAFAAGRPSPLPELPIQYGDFAVWQRKWLRGETLETQLAYWKRQLAGMPPMLELPADRPRPALVTHRGSSYPMAISARLTEGLTALSQRESATLFMTVLAAFQTLLSRYTGLTDFGVGTPIANRTQLEVEGLIGFFANTLVMRADLSGNPTFREALGRVRTTAINAYAYQDLPFETLVEELEPARDHSRNPLFNLMFVFQNLPSPSSPEPLPGLTVSPMEVTNGTAKFDLTLYVSTSGQGLNATWRYNTDLFDATRIARMAGHFHTLLAGIVATPDSPLSELPLLSDAERRQLLVTWNQTEMPYCRDRCFHQLFEEQVQLSPDAPAVQCGEEQLTYRELNGRANQLAWRLQEMGVGPETAVGIFLTRSVGTVAALLAVMKAGGAYVPLDPAYPAEHIAFMQKDAKVAVLLTETRLLPLLDAAMGIPDAHSGNRPPRAAMPPSCIPKVVCLDSDSPVTARELERNPVSGTTPTNLAYVIYTSGSTGQPKGVMITHANLCHYIHAMRAALGIRADDAYLHTASFAFSSSVRQYAVPLSCGSHVVIAPTETIRHPQALFALIRQQGVSIIDLVPSYWRICKQALAGLEPAPRAHLVTNRLRLILSASEPLLSDGTEESGLGFGKDVRLINMFGQTETAGIVTVYLVPLHAAASPTIVPIGRPIANTRAYVLDPFRQPVPIGVWGELYIGGAAVGRGYLNDPEATADKFVPDPFSELPGARLYRTGDVTRYLPDGNLEFSGRVDHQMKHLGHRIEPEQIESVVGQHPGWRESAVVMQEDTNGEGRLVAYVVPNSGVPSSTLELRAFLKRTLPDYMIPSRIVTLLALPRTPNGKLDRAALGSQLGGPVTPSKVWQEGAPGLSAEGVRPALAAGQLEPPTRAEEILTAVWAQVLCVDRVRLDDNFFDLGGNSILSIQMINRANQAGLRLSPKQLFQHQTIAELARAAVASPLSSSAGQAEERLVPEPAPRRNPRMTAKAHSRVRVTVESLRAYGREALERAGLAPEGASIVTEVQLEASLRDQPTHNMVSIPRYARRIASGSINPRPDIRIERRTDISAQVDGDNGPGQWVAVTAMELAIRIAREKGVGIVGVRRSNHLGAAGHYPWLAAREGLIGLCTTNGPVILAPTGGITPTFGNNPLGVGIPAGCYHPILLDIAMSVAPRGRIGLQLAEGRELPPGWILDRNGHPSTDPADLVAGLGVPIGGHKGYGLTLVMEVLAGVLTGAGFGWDNRRAHTPQTEKPANFGHFFMAIDPELFMPLAEFTTRVDRMIEQTKAGERAEGVGEILVPGESELRARERSLQDGVLLRLSTYDALRKYAQRAGLDTALAVVE